MDKTFIRVRSTKDIIISAILVLGGCVMVALPTSTSVNICGFFMIFTGIILFMILRTAYKDTDTGTKYLKTEHYFAQSLREEITNAISKKPESVNMAEEDKGNGIRLDIYHSKGEGKAYVQLFEYIPYKYEPCSRMYEYGISEVNKLLK